jgi:aminoglycoside phosphotransferase (APT) family kinase protein
VSARFHVTDLPGDPPRVEKRGDPGAIAREAEALTILTGRPWVPALVEHSPGRMVSTRLPGAPRPIAAIGASEAQRLGALVREAHEVRRGADGGLWSWARPSATLAGYRRRRAEDTEALLAGGAHAGLARRALGRAGDDGARPEPFRMLHGDLVESNVVWGPDGPALVDWEFWRMGDPAEDLAYLIEVNGLPPAVVSALIEGYALPGIGRRVDRWRALVAADAGAWYLAEGTADRAALLLERARSACARGEAGA